LIRLTGKVGEQLEKALTEQEQTTPVNEPVVETPPTQEVENLKQETPTETPAPVNPEASTELEKDWDDESPETPAVEVTNSTPSFDFSELGKSIGLGEIKDKDELVTKIKSLETKALDGVPDNLKKALELAKQGGDYLSYLGVSQVDYSSVDPVELFKNDLFARIKSMNPQATKQELEDRYTEALGAYAPIQQLVEGQKLQKSYTDYQKSEAIRIEQEARQRKATADAKVKESIDRLEEINGFKLKPNHKAQMYDYITSGQLQKDLFSQDGYNYEALVDIAFQRKFGKKATEFLWNKAKTTTKKEIVKELTNPQIEKPVEKPSVENTEVNPMEAWLKQLQAKRTK
jgi:hypothetical protein